MQAQLDHMVQRLDQMAVLLAAMSGRNPEDGDAVVAAVLASLPHDRLAAELTRRAVS